MRGRPGGITLSHAYSRLSFCFLLRLVFRRSSSSSTYKPYIAQLRQRFRSFGPPRHSHSFHGAMHDELHRSRKLAFDEKVIDERRATVADRSAVLQRILGYAKVNGPFTAPPPLPAADTVSASTVLMPTVSSGHAVSKDLQPLSSVAARMKWSPTIDVVAQRNVKSQPSLGRQEATTQIAQPISNSSLPH